MIALNLDYAMAISGIADSIGTIVTHANTSDLSHSVDIPIGLQVDNASSRVK